MVDSMAHNGVGQAVIDYLSTALADGSYVAAPEPEIVGKGLESVQRAYERQARGMSAQKAVVSVL